MLITRTPTMTPRLQCEVTVVGKRCMNYADYDYYPKGHEIPYVRLCEYHDGQYVQKQVTYELVGLP